MSDTLYYARRYPLGVIGALIMIIFVLTAIFVFDGHEDFVIDMRQRRLRGENVHTVIGFLGPTGRFGARSRSPSSRASPGAAVSTCRSEGFAPQ